MGKPSSKTGTKRKATTARRKAVDDSDPIKLTIKQEGFARAHVELGNASEAYRRNYNTERMKPNTIWVAACTLLANPKVARRIEQLQQLHLERHNLTVDDIIRELEEAREVAAKAESPQTASMVSASLGKAKLLGMLKDKVEHSGGLTLNVNFGPPAE